MISAIRAASLLCALLLAWGCGKAASNSTPVDPGTSGPSTEPVVEPPRPDPILPPPDLPANRVERGRLLVEDGNCAGCHNEAKIAIGWVPPMEAIGLRLWKWKKGSLEECLKWLNDLFTFPKTAEDPPWRRGMTFSSSSAKPSLSLTMTERQIEDIAYYLMSLREVATLR